MTHEITLEFYRQFIFVIIYYDLGPFSTWKFILKVHWKFSVWRTEPRTDKHLSLPVRMTGMPTWVFNMSGIPTCTEYPSWILFKLKAQLRLGQAQLMIFWIPMAKSNAKVETRMSQLGHACSLKYCPSLWIFVWLALGFSLSCNRWSDLQAVQSSNSIAAMKYRWHLFYFCYGHGLNWICTWIYDGILKGTFAFLSFQEKFTPVKYFSIDRVFRNETLDATHLAEFHQIEGLVADRNLTLGDLMGVIHEFFKKLGIKKLRFKPAYNPYTEPSMEIFSYHEGLQKWVEIGNSGVFRPEMLLPMGLPEDVSVIAWGLSLERPTMIKYGIDNIRELFGPRVNLQMVYDNPICRLEKSK